MIYALNGGSLGLDCNHGGTDCSAVYEARSATFCALFLQGLFITWHLISIEESILQVQPIQRFKANPLLFWSVIFGLISIPLCIYPPIWSTDVFRQGSLSAKGWGVALAANAIFWFTVEAWKYFARRGGWMWLTQFTGGGIYKRSCSELEKGNL
jgi:Na+-exporting ATPase